MYRIQCSEVWGGIRDRDQDAESAGIAASIYSGACEGGKGGDIYYLSVCGRDMLTRIAVADVVGHGSVVSEVSQFLYETLVRHMNAPSSSDVLAEVNRIAADRGLSAMTTAAIAAFYTADRRLHFAYAGHHPVLVHRADTTDWFAARPDYAETIGDNTPLAVLPEATFDEYDLPLGAGDRLLLYTDGVLEAMNDRGEQFGSDRLLEVLDEHAGAPLPRVKAGVLDALRGFTGGNLSHDDVTVIAVEVR